jgi:hypothetical protein
LNAITSDTIVGLSKSLQIVHHVPGRLRVRFVGKGLPTSGGASLQDFRTFIENIRGVERLRISPATLSAIVEYDGRVLSSSVWDDLINGPEQATRLAFEALTVPSHTE